MKRTAKIIVMHKSAETVKFNPMQDMSDEFLQDRILDAKTPIEFKKAFAKELRRREKRPSEVGHRA